MAARRGGDMRGPDEPAHSSSGQSTDIKKLHGLSNEAILWIQLYHDLLLAIARTPARPLVIVTDVIVYKIFLKYFKPEHFANDQELFFRERKALLPTRIDMIKRSFNYQEGQDVEIIHTFAITSEMLEKYKELRRTLEPSEEIKNPEKNATLWEFLNVAVRNEYPALYSVLSESQDLGSKDTGNMQTTPVQAAHASQPAFHSNAPAPSPALSSTSGITLVFTDIFIEDGKAKKADNGPRADQERVHRLPTTSRPHRRQPGQVLGQEPPQIAETSKHKAGHLSEHPAAEPAKTAKRKASPNAQQNDGENAKKRARIQRDGDEVKATHVKTKWTKAEHKMLFDTINEWCYRNGIDKLEMKVVNRICSDAFKAAGSSRDKSVIASKTKNMKEIVGLIKKAKDMALHVEDFSGELRYPLAALRLNADDNDENDENGRGQDSEERSPV